MIAQILSHALISPRGLEPKRIERETGKIGSSTGVVGIIGRLLGPESTTLIAHDGVQIGDRSVESGTETVVGQKIGGVPVRLKTRFQRGQTIHPVECSTRKIGQLISQVGIETDLDPFENG